MTHPHDLALLYDLLDGRIAPAAADELRKRLTEEPELAAAWDELQRMRDGLRALPAPPVPAGFLEGVRTRAGIVSKPAVSRPAPVAKEGAPSDATAAPAGNVFRLRPFAYAVAASVGLAAGLAGYLVATRPDATAPKAGLATASKETEGGRLEAESAEDRSAEGPGAAARKEEDALGRSRQASDERDATEKNPALKDAERNEAHDADDGSRRAPDSGVTPPPSPAPGSPAPIPRFGAPGGAVSPGLREPSDSPRPSVGAGRSAPAAGPRPTPMPPLPTTPDAPPPAPERAVGDDRGTGGAARPEEAFAYVREGVDDVLVVRANSLDEARAQVSLFYVSLDAPAPGADAKAPATPAPVLRRYAGSPVVRLVDERLRADVAKSLGALDGVRGRGGESAPASAPAPAEPPSAGGAPAGARRADAPSGPAGGEAGAVPPESQVVLGSFLLDLTGDQWARANARIAADESSTRLDGATKTASGAPAATPPAAPAPPGFLVKGKTDAKSEPGTGVDKSAAPAKPTASAPSPTAPGEPARGDEPAADGTSRRRVRILVLPLRPTPSR